MNHDLASRAKRNVWARVAQNMCAVFLCMAGVASIGLFITALAGSFGTPTWVAAGVTVALLVGGTMAARAGGRRRAAETTLLVYAPDFTGDLFDVDRGTAVRTARLTIVPIGPGPVPLI